MKRTYKLDNEQWESVMRSLFTSISGYMTDGYQTDSPERRRMCADRAREYLDVYYALGRQRGLTDEMSSHLRHWRISIADLSISAERDMKAKQEVQ